MEAVGVRRLGLELHKGQEEGVRMRLGLELHKGQEEGVRTRLGLELHYSSEFGSRGRADEGRSGTIFFISK